MGERSAVHQGDVPAPAGQLQGRRRPEGPGTHDDGAAAVGAQCGCGARPGVGWSTGPSAVTVTTGSPMMEPVPPLREHPEGAPPTMKVSR